ncbi:sodium/potassium/calcium exchanger 1-like isoform X2 [Lolium rigidum]|nr:sodium/potassium/calcium exchanger 1-like isoform X2 [Lolium rigidum]
MAEEGRLVAGSGELIRPPRLEDAGLEDCALPPESIAEAFSLAAMAVSSRFPRLSLSDDEDEGDAPLAPRGGCVEDAGPTCGAIPDALVGAGGGREGGADEVVVIGGGGGEGGGDEVVVVGRGDEEDRVVVVGGELQKKLGQEKGCVDGIRKEEEQKEEEEDIAEKAILVEDFA